MLNNREFEVNGVEGYSIMCNHHFRDKNLTLKAKGLLSLMLSLPESWDYSINGLVKLSKDGKDSIKSALRELQIAKYVSITKFRDEFGLFKYKYTVYYLPYPEWVKKKNSSRVANPGLDNPVLEEPDMEVPDMENPLQLNNNISNNKILNNKYKNDNIDNKKEFKNDASDLTHNYLTKEVIKSGYIGKEEESSFLFDDFFENLIASGYSYRRLLKLTSYIIDKVKSRDFKDENGNIINNKFGYFKSSLLSNINKFEKESNDSLYDDMDWIDDIFDNREDKEL